MTITKTLRAMLLLPALAFSFAASAGDVSYDQLQLRTAQTAKAPRAQRVASVGRAACGCHPMSMHHDDSAAELREGAGMEERAAPGRAESPERPTTGIHRR